MKRKDFLNRTAVTNTTEVKKPLLLEKTAQGGGNTTPTEIKPEEVKPEAPITKVEPPVTEKPKEAVVIPMNIEAKLKLVNQLNRLSIQRENLITRITQLEAFEIAVGDDADELDPNPYQRCKLAIFDDQGKQFTVQSPGLVKMVVGFIREACQDAKVTIEEQIIFPSAA